MPDADLPSRLARSASSRRSVTTRPSPAATTSPGVYYQEGRGMSATNRVFLVAILGLVVYIFIDEARAGRLDTRAILIALGVGALAAVIILAIGRWTTADFRTMVVDDQGLHISPRRQLARHQISRVMVLTHRQADTARPGLFSSLYNAIYAGVHLRANRMLYDYYTSQPAILVTEHDHDPAGREYGWLISTRNPEAFAAALQQIGAVRDHVPDDTR